MIDFLKGLLVELLTTQTPPILSTPQIGFNAPDQDWRNLISGFSDIALNIYLVEMYQDLDLRSNERVATMTPGGVVQTRVPTRLNCRYLISAWSPAKTNPLTDPAIDEDVLLYEVARVLLENSPLDAEQIYPPGSLPAGFPDDMLAPPLPAVVASSEPFPKLADFWMRMDTIWKPVVDLTVTLPVAHAPRAPVPAVTTLLGEYGTLDHAALEELLVIGGVVRASPSEDPVPSAWVRLVELDAIVTADLAGRFVFADIRRGSYTLEAGGPGLTAGTQHIDVPTLSGNYDVHVT